MWYHLQSSDKRGHLGWIYLEMYSKYMPTEVIHTDRDIFCQVQVGNGLHNKNYLFVGL